ncbi:hypothetical protein B7494_g3962 [Chlorociboria aeruginascens]|nr:hypothetical protein B7494_g3962 [Chlorociboria aeruginascens]
MGNISFESLLDILRSRDIPFDRDALQTAFEDPDSQTAIQEWVQEFLSEDTLLTKEEAALYAALEKSGEADTLAASQDLSQVQGLSEQEIRSAIEELKRSTAAIEKQSDTLKLQQNAMSMLVKSNKKTHHARSQADKNQLQKWEDERGHVNNAVEELSRNLKYQISDLEQQAKTSEATIKQTADSILRSDDKLLSSLQKLSSDLDPSNSDGDDTIPKIRELCARLIKHTVEGVRTRLDRIYLESLIDSSTANGIAHDQDVTDLQEELESLYSEILPVAQMSAEQQYLEPALREVASKSGQGQDRSIKAVKYIHDCLDYLVSKIGMFLERIEEHRCHQMAVRAVIDTAKKELQSEITTSNKPIKPSRQRKASTSQPPVRARNSRRRSSLQDEEVEASQHLLRTLGISLPTPPSTDELTASQLSTALLDRQNKLKIHMSSLQLSTETTISNHLLDISLTLQLLHDSLLSETPHNKIHLFDPELQGMIGMLESEIQEVVTGLGEVDLQKVEEGNFHRAKIVERWGR